MNRSPFANGVFRLVLSFEKLQECGYCGKSAHSLNIGDQTSFNEHLRICKHGVTQQ